jgi:predicted DNA-binding transcriptional regulator YafY
MLDRMNGPSVRMLELLSLLQGGRTWPATELAAKVDTTPRTLRRDLDRLRELGYPVVSTRGPGGSYRLVAGRAMPPLTFTDDEAVAAVVGLRYAAQVLSDDAASGALLKVEQALPPRLRDRMAAVSASTTAVSRATLDVRVVEALARAATATRDVRFSYVDRSGETTARHVEPYRQVLLGRRWYLLGWDLDRADWRTFRVDRIESVEVPGSTFAPRGPLPDTMVSTAPAGVGRAVVRFAAPVSVVASRLTAEAGTLEPIDHESCRFTTAPDEWSWLAGAVAAVGVPYTVEGPAELVAQTRALAARVAAATA